MMKDKKCFKRYDPDNIACKVCDVSVECFEMRNKYGKMLGNYKRIIFAPDKPNICDPAKGE